MKIIQIKLKLTNTRWEDQPIYLTLTLAGTRSEIEETADSIGKHLANRHGIQSRWEYEGVGQGHYNYPDSVNTR